LAQPRGRGGQRRLTAENETRGPLRVRWSASGAAARDTGKRGAVRLAERVRWGILGTAAIAENQFIPAVRASRRGEVVAVAARDGARAAAYARRHGIPKAVAGYAELLADPDIDAVYIPLPNALHAQWTQAAAAAGKHVICEKPLAANAAEAAAAVAACTQAGVALFECFVYHYHPQTLRIAGWLREGAIGEVRTVHANFHFVLAAERRRQDIRMSAPLAGGAMMDLGCYPVSWLRFAFGTEPLAAAAQAVWDPQAGVDTQMVGMLTFPGGRAGTFDCSFDCEHVLETTIVGTAGRIVVAQPFHPRGSGATVRLLRRGQPEEFHVDARDEPAFLPAVEGFHDTVLDGAPLRVPPRDGIDNLAVLDAVRASAHGGGVLQPVLRP
jgi:xylose dehydrogenase (NAD/NADP)